MPCGCGGSTQQASQRRREITSTRSAAIDTKPVSVADPSLYWNGPKRTVEPTRASRRTQ